MYHGETSLLHVFQKIYMMSTIISFQLQIYASLVNGYGLCI